MMRLFLQTIGLCEETLPQVQWNALRQDIPAPPNECILLSIGSVFLAEAHIQVLHCIHAQESTAEPFHGKT
jgi:hypothetical protein